MQPAPKADQRRSIDSFAPLEEVDAPEPLDRSLLEAWSVCPFQAHALESKLVTVVGELAVIGEFAHQAFSAATRAWIDSGMQLSVRDLVQEIENEALMSRPDVQPDVLWTTRRMMWDWAKYITRYNAHNIQGFDGGEDSGKSGQFSMDLAGKVVTTEFDFLATIGEIGYDDDLKTGWKEHTDSVVEGSFQFDTHAAIAFANFPDLETLLVRCWNTRRGTTSGWVPYHRRNKIQYEARIIAAIAARERGEFEPWPTLEKCAICPAASLCPASDEVTKTESQDQLRQLIAADAKADALRKSLTLHVDKHGEIVLPDGTAFGRERPATERKKPVAIYQLKEKADG